MDKFRSFPLEYKISMAALYNIQVRVNISYVSLETLQLLMIRYGEYKQHTEVVDDSMRRGIP